MGYKHVYTAKLFLLTPFACSLCVNYTRVVLGYGKLFCVREYSASLCKYGCIHVANFGPLFSGAARPETICDS